MQAQSLRDVRSTEDLDRIGRHRSWRRDLGERTTIRPPKLERAVRLAHDLIALFVDGPMVAATEQRDVRERRRAACRPVADVMALAEGQTAAREAAAPIPVEERSP